MKSQLPNQVLEVVDVTIYKISLFSINSPLL